MKKKLILILSGCLLLVAGIAGAIVLLGKPAPENCTPESGTLYVNGREITSENVTIYSNYADLPLTEVMKALEISVEWIDKSTAEITCNSKEYILNLVEVTLTDYGRDNNFLIPAPGDRTFHCTVLEKELVLDDNTVHSIMYAMENNISISIDHEKSIVYVTERND